MGWRRFYLVLFCAYMVLNGKELLVSMALRNAASSGLRLPLVYVYMAFPIASFLVCLRLLGVLAGDWKKLTGKREEEGKLTYECTCIIRKFLYSSLLTVPIGYAIGISSLIAIYYYSDIPLIIIAQKAITGVDSFPLLAIPFLCWQAI